MADVSTLFRASIDGARSAIRQTALERRMEMLERKSVPDNWPGWTQVFVQGAGSYVLPEDKATLLKEGFRNWSYTAIMLIMDHISGLEWYLYKGNARDAELSPIDDSPFLDFIGNPNENQSLREFLELTLLHYELTGEFFWHKVRNGNGGLYALELLRPDCIEPNLDGRVLTGWTYKKDSSMRGEFLPRKDVIHKLRPHPYAIMQGYSPIAATCYTVQMDHDIRVHEQAFFRNGARPDYIVNPEGDAFTEDQKNDIQQRIEERHGGPSGAYKPMVLGGTKVNVIPLNMSNKDQQFKDLSDWVFKTIFLSRGIPLGLLEPQSSRAHAYQADKVFNKWCISPRLTILSEALTEAAKEFDKQYFTKYENIIPRDAEFDLAKTQAYLSAGVYSVNEVRAWEGLEPFEGEEFDMPKQSAPPVFGAASLPPAQQKDVKDADYDRRTKVWEAYIEKANKKETLLRAAVNSAFDWDRKEIKARIKGSKDAKSEGDLFPSQSEWMKAWDKFLRGPGSKIFKDFAQDGIDGLGVSLDFDFEHAAIRSQFDKLLKEGIKELTGTTRDKLGNALSEAIARGDSAGDLSRLVDETIDGWKAGKSRGYTIARTETGILSNAGTHAGFEQIATEIGRRVIKEWVATRDERTRDSHADADGQERPYDEPFEIDGADMMYPGDGSDAGPEELVNCRCTMASRLEDE